MTTTTAISLNVNGATHTVEASPDSTLLEVLRNDLDLIGAKQACDVGECGSCIVMFGGKGVMSCLLPARRAQNKPIVTIEGLAEWHSESKDSPAPESSDLHPLQQAFIDLGASQCGYCIPGIIMEASALLAKNANPTRDDVVKRLSRNICRCTGYVKVVEAVLGAAEAIRSGTLTMKEATIGGPMVGASITRVDDREKVTGEARYAADLKMTGVLHAKVLRSKVHHARIISIDTSAAEAVPGVVAAVTAKDIPGSPEMPNAKPQRFLFPSDKIRFMGEALAAVAAESEEAAEEALSKIIVNYEELPPVLDFRKADDPEAPLINPPEPNTVISRRVISGDAKAAMEKADVVVRNTFSTPRWEHFYMEPEAGLGYIDEDERIFLNFPSHEPFEGHDFVASLLNLDRDRVRIFCPTMGGNFGGREDYMLVGVLALLVHKTRKPVRLVFTREESLLGSSKWFGFYVDCTTGATKDGKLVAIDSQVLVDGGNWSHHPGQEINDCVGRNIYFLTGPYLVPDVRIETSEACTNSGRAIPIRGITSINAALVHESQMDILAEKLDMDKLDFRIKNALQVGDTLHTGMFLEESVEVKATLEQSKRPYAEARARAEASPPPTPWKRGVGIGTGWRAVGVGGTYSAAAELLESGKVQVLVGAVEKGQGSRTAMAQIAAQELGLPIDAIEVVMGDTIAAPYHHITASQGTITLVGGAVHQASIALKKALIEVASEVLEDSPENMECSGGRVSSTRAPGEQLTFQELARHFESKDLPTKYEGSFAYKFAKTYSEKSGLQAFDPVTGQGSNCDIFAYATCLAELDVNTETGQVKVNRVTYVADSGKIIHPLSFEGQCQGGVVYGQGLALSEQYIPGETRTIKDYGLTSIREAPVEIDVITVEGSYSQGPFGAKGGGEMSDVPIVGAIINGIADATGARVYDLPATPARVLEALARG